jgi:hypothetical protein
LLVVAMVIPFIIARGAEPRVHYGANPWCGFQPVG